jgi:hypothetical protein
MGTKSVNAMKQLRLPILLPHQVLYVMLVRRPSFMTLVLTTSGDPHFSSEAETSSSSLHRWFKLLQDKRLADLWLY